MPKIQKQSLKKRPEKSGVLARVDPLGEDSDGLKVNVYGRSGTGKTTFWSTFPSPILALISSGGDKPGELRSIDTPENRKRISKLVLEQPSDVEEVAQSVGDSYATVVLDHATGLQDLVLKSILGLSDLPPQGSWGMASQQDWGQCALQTKEHLRRLLNLDCNVVIIAQEREFNTDSESDIIMPYVGSALTPSTAGWLNTACDYIVQTFIRRETQVRVAKIGGKSIETKQTTGKVQYCLRTGPDPVYTTKFRIPRGLALPEVIVDPDYDKLMALFKNRR